MEDLTKLPLKTKQSKNKGTAATQKQKQITTKQKGAKLSDIMFSNSLNS